MKIYRKGKLIERDKYFICPTCNAAWSEDISKCEYLHGVYICECPNTTCNTIVKEMSKENFDFALKYDEESWKETNSDILKEIDTLKEEVKKYWEQDEIIYPNKIISPSIFPAMPNEYKITVGDIYPPNPEVTCNSNWITEEDIND